MNIVIKSHPWAEWPQIEAILYLSRKHPNSLNLEKLIAFIGISSKSIITRKIFLKTCQKSVF